MDTTTKDAVVVGVSGPGRETAALRWAVDRARRDGAEVVAVHAFRTALTGPPPRALLTFADTADMAHWVIKQVGDELAELTDGTVPFRTLAVAGTPAHVLVDLGRDARAVVVQHHLPHGLRRLFAGSTAYAVGSPKAWCAVSPLSAQWASTSARAAPMRRPSTPRSRSSTRKASAHPGSTWGVWVSIVMTGPSRTWVRRC
jgi:nucleotide-binding universal stress UspA family protein